VLSCVVNEKYHKNVSLSKHWRVTRALASGTCMFSHRWFWRKSNVRWPVCANFPTENPQHNNGFTTQRHYNDNI